ncbi:MAG: hypothetical protein DRO12_04435 [Thermoprotei archaeon]|nr:MAG: hypothetical protein DRO12_04435 [Thermoprotei archaeon]
MKLTKCLETVLRAPKDYSLDLTLRIYNFHWYYLGNGRGYVFLELDPPIVAFVAQKGPATLSARIYSVTCRDIDANNVSQQLSFHLGPEEDLSEFLDLASRDPLLKLFAKKFRGWRLRTTSLWWALVIGICQQNTGFRQGWRMLANIIKLLGKRVWVEDREVPLPPSPLELIEKHTLLKPAGVGYRWRTLFEVATRFARRELKPSRLYSMDTAGAEKVLRNIRGVGSYTARLALALSLRKYELPPIDRWAKKIFSYAYQVDENEAERECIRRWGRWSALAVIALTIALDAEPLKRALERVKRGELLPNERNTLSPYNLWMWKF